jgi:hypothetical protein
VDDTSTRHVRYAACLWMMHIAGAVSWRVCATRMAELKPYSNAIAPAECHLVEDGGWCHRVRFGHENKLRNESSTVQLDSADDELQHEHPEPKEDEEQVWTYVKWERILTRRPNESMIIAPAAPLALSPNPKVEHILLAMASARGSCCAPDLATDD